jgi:hypothetical protein
VAEAIRVVGLKELSRTFKRMSKELSDDLTDELKEAAQVVADDAQELALTQIRNMPRSPRWAGMRIGVSRAQGVVYVVPAARARRRPGRARANLSDLLLEEAMDPAVAKNQDKVVRKLEDMIDRIASQNGF